MANKKKKGVVKNNVVWDGDGNCYREVLDDSTVNAKLGEVCHSVIDNSKTGEGHFEYGPAPKE